MSLEVELGFDFASEPCETFIFSGYPCRKCLPCLRHRQKAWVTRLVEELREHDYNYFVTLTYDMDHVPVDDSGLMHVCKHHLIKLNRDLRKRFQQGSFLYKDDSLNYQERFSLPDLKYKFYLTSEYGPVGGLPHYHGVFYNFPSDRYLVELLFKQLWPYGFISVFPALEGAAGYVSKYLVSDGAGKMSYQDDFLNPPFALMSKGIGLAYVNRMLSFHQADPKHRSFYQYHGNKGVLDRYLKHKIFTEEQLQYFAESFASKSFDIRSRYNYLRQNEPETFEALLSERKQYFSNINYAERQKVLKKHSIK